MNLKDELKKRHSFSNAKHEAMLSIMRTSDLLENRVARVLREFGLTPSQYNVLRILRGEGKPLPTIEVASRMIQVAPAITRVVDQLCQKGLISREQSEHDGRVFLIQPTSAGKRLLKKMDAPVNQIHQDLMAAVPDEQLELLSELLTAIRQRIRQREED